jgi:hypothetical protein
MAVKSEGLYFTFIKIVLGYSSFIEYKVNATFMLLS